MAAANHDRGVQGKKKGFFILIDEKEKRIKGGKEARKGGKERRKGGKRKGKKEREILYIV